MRHSEECRNDRAGLMRRPDDGTNLEEEPDCRFTLANERTYLAWLRTSLALLAAAVAIAGSAPGSMAATRMLTSVPLAALGVVAAAASALRWQRVDRAIRRGDPLPVERTPWLLAGGIAVSALFALPVVVLLGLDS